MQMENCLTTDHITDFGVDQMIKNTGYKYLQSKTFFIQTKR